MNAIVNTGPGRLDWQELPCPIPPPGWVRIRTRACGVCSTDLEMIAGWSRTGFPSVPGHEWSGVVDAVGPEVDEHLKGQSCVAENVLSDGGEVGFEHPGGYAECFLTEARHLHPLPDTMPPDVAALIEPLAVVVRACRRARLDAAVPVLIVGDGPIGLLMTLVLARRGFREVSLLGGRPHRLALAQDLGARATMNYHEAGAGASLRKAFQKPFAVVVEASGSGAGADAALSLVAPAGRLLIIGSYGEAQARFQWNHVLLNEIELIGSNASAQAWFEAVRLAGELRADMAKLITHQFPASRFAEAIKLARGRSSAVKVLLRWERPS